MEITENKFKKSTNIAENVKAAVEPVAVYDPKKKYNWETHTAFVLQGTEFGTLINTLRNFLNTKEAQLIFMMKEASDVMENVLARSVAAGIVKEDKGPNQMLEKLIKEKAIIPEEAPTKDE